MDPSSLGMDSVDYWTPRGLDHDKAHPLIGPLVLRLEPEGPLPLVVVLCPPVAVSLCFGHVLVLLVVVVSDVAGPYLDAP